MWIEPELYPTCSPWLLSPVNMVLMLGKAIVRASHTVCRAVCKTREQLLYTRQICHGWFVKQSHITRPLFLLFLFPSPPILTIVVALGVSSSFQLMTIQFV